MCTMPEANATNPENCTVAAGETAFSYTHFLQGTSMRFFRLLSDWAFTRLFWFCVLASSAQADVILWDAGFTGSAAFTPIAGGEIRSQAIDLATAATAKTITLSLGQPPWLAGTGGPSQISLWLDSTPAERRTLIYSGAFRNSWSGLAIDLPKGRSFLSLENLAGSRTINWNQQVIDGVTGSFMGQITGVAVPEPGAVVILLVCCAAGVFTRGRGVDNANQVHGVSRLGLLSVRWCR